ncbi:unnamed protein product [Rotaria magnacalcarata]|uniref:Uncharacterized protein n=2 Tax=Rotaria magnacalcarata TaxID=392030 RepID=A0A8S2QZT0_9BILA|nr:unnamed protein product [Rotaria magnacalcarata]
MDEGRSIRSKNDCLRMLLSHHHIQIKKRRWRAKKKDQHHRTQDEQEMSDRWEEYGKLILALTKAGTTIDYQMAKQIAEECRVPLKQ